MDDVLIVEVVGVVDLGLFGVLLGRDLSMEFMEVSVWGTALLVRVMGVYWLSDGRSSRFRIRMSTRTWRSLV